MNRKHSIRFICFAASLLPSVGVSYASMPNGTSNLSRAVYLSTDFENNDIVVTSSTLAPINGNSLSTPLSKVVPPASALHLHALQKSRDWTVRPVMLVNGSHVRWPQFDSLDSITKTVSPKYAGMDIVANPGDDSSWRNPWYKRIALKPTLIASFGVLIPAVMVLGLKRTTRE